MANIKFSQFTAETDINNFTDIVGYSGANNTKITPADLASSLVTLQGGPFLPLTAGATKPLTGDLNLAATGAGPSVGSQAVVFNGVDDASAAVIGAKIFTLDSTVNPSGQDLIFQVADDNGVLQEYMRVDAFGFVGIGRNAPAANLDVAADMIVGTNVTFSAYGSGTQTGTATKSLAVTASGDVVEIDLPSGGTSAFVTKSGGDSISWDFATDGPNILVNLTLSENKLVVSNANDFPDGSTGYVVFDPTTSSNYKLPDVLHGSGTGITSKLTNGNTSLGGTNPVLWQWVYDGGNSTFYWQKFENMLKGIYPPNINFPLTNLVAYYSPEAFNQATQGNVSSGATVANLTSSNTIGDLQISSNTTNFQFFPATATDPAFWSMGNSANAITRGSTLSSGITTKSTFIGYMQGPYLSQTFGGIFDFLGTQAGAAFDQGFYLSNLSFLLFSPNYIFGYPSLIDYSGTGGADLTSDWIFMALQFFPSTTTGSNDGSVKLTVGCKSSYDWAVANPPGAGATTNWDYQNGDGTGNTVPVTGEGLYIEQSGSSLDIDEFLFENVILGNAANFGENNPCHYGEFGIFNDTISDSQIEASWKASRGTYGV